MIKEFALSGTMWNSGKIIEIMQLIQPLFVIFLPHLIQLQIITLQSKYLLRIGKVFEFCLFQKESVLQKVVQKNLNLNSFDQ